jgi:hypothetical protein
MLSPDVIMYYIFTLTMYLGVIFPGVTFLGVSPGDPETWDPVLRGYCAGAPVKGTQE